MDVFRQRLEDEYNASVIITAPTVPYQSSLRRFRIHVRLPISHLFSRVQGQDCDDQQSD